MKLIAMLTLSAACVLSGSAHASGPAAERSGLRRIDPDKRAAILSNPFRSASPKALAIRVPKGRRSAQRQHELSAMAQSRDLAIHVKSSWLSRSMTVTVGGEAVAVDRFIETASMRYNASSEGQPTQMKLERVPQHILTMSPSQRSFVLLKK